MKTALVLGTGNGVVSDMDAALSLFTPDVTIAVNHAGIEFEGIDHWATCHADLLDQWLEKRDAKGYAFPQIWFEEARAFYDSDIVKRFHARTAPYWEGSSGVLGISVAQVLGCDRIVLAGMPLTDTPHLNDDTTFSWAEFYQRNWEKNLHRLDGVKSMSGWTKTLLGRPTKAWLKPKAEPVDEGNEGETS